MKYRVVRETSDQPIDFTVAPGVAWQLESVRLHLDAGGAATDLTITVEAGASTAAGEYDVVLVTQAMGGVTDYFYKPDFPIPFGPDDEVTIAYTNGDTATYGLEVYYQGI